MEATWGIPINQQCKTNNSQSTTIGCHYSHTSYSQFVCSSRWGWYMISWWFRTWYIIFGGTKIHKSQLFWCENQGFLLMAIFLKARFPILQWFWVQMGICKDWHSSHQASPLSSSATPGASLGLNWSRTGPHDVGWCWKMLGDSNMFRAILHTWPFLLVAFGTVLDLNWACLSFRMGGTLVVVFLLKVVIIGYTWIYIIYMCVCYCIYCKPPDYNLWTIQCLGMFRDCFEDNYIIYIYIIYIYIQHITVYKPTKPIGFTARPQLLPGRSLHSFGEYVDLDEAGIQGNPQQMWPVELPQWCCIKPSISYSICTYDNYIYTVIYLLIFYILYRTYV